MPRGRIAGPGRLWRRGSTWMCDYRDENGVRHNRALATSRAAAEQIRASLIHQRDLARAGLIDRAGQQLPLADVIARYGDDLRPRVSPRHHEMVEARLKRMLTALGPVRVCDLKALAVTRIRSEATAAGASPRSANLLVDTLAACLRWAEQAEVIGKNPIARVKRLPEAGHERRRRRPLSDDEIERLLRAAEDEDRELARVAELDGRTRVPQAPFLRALVTLGMRYGEARSIAWGSVDFEQRVVVLQASTTKSRKQRVLPLSDELVAMLRSLQAIHARALGRIPSSTDHVFVTANGCVWSPPSNNLRRVFVRLLQRAGIRRVAPDGSTVDVHALRTSAASRWVRKGVPLVVTQKLLGHADPRVTARHYIHVEVDSLRAAIDSTPAQVRRVESA